jgi:hypothetical protein
MTLAFSEWIAISTKLPDAAEAPGLIERIDNSYNGHRADDPMTLELSMGEMSLITIAVKRLDWLRVPGWG